MPLGRRSGGGPHLRAHDGSAGCIYPVERGGISLVYGEFSSKLKVAGNPMVISLALGIVGRSFVPGRCQV